MKIKVFEHKNGAISTASSEEITIETSAGEVVTQAELTVSEDFQDNLGKHEIVKDKKTKQFKVD